MSNNVKLYRERIVPKILNLPSGTVFRLRDLEENCPSLPGRWLVRDAKELGIEKIEGDPHDSNLWKKM